MYLIKLVSKVKKEQVALFTAKIAKALNTDPLKIEKMLSKDSQANIGKARTVEKAEEIASVFRGVGVEVAVIEEGTTKEIRESTQQKKQTSDDAKEASSEEGIPLSQISVEPPWYRDIIGFRSDKGWKKFVALAAYGFGAVLVLTIIFRGSSGRSLITIILLATLTAFLMGYAFRQYRFLRSYKKRYGPIIDLEVEKSKVIRDLKKLEKANDTLKAEGSKLTDRYEELKKELVSLEDELDIRDYGLYEPKYDFETAERYKEEVDVIREYQKALVKSNSTLAVVSMLVILVHSTNYSNSQRKNHQ